MINIYVDQDAMSALYGLESSTVVTAKKDIRIEFIDAAALTAEVEYNGMNAEIRVYVRNEMHTNSQMVHHGTVKENHIDVDEGEEGTITIAYSVAEGANKLLQEKGMLDACAELDEDVQGVLFGIDNDEEITIKIVKGKKRPALLCMNPFGARRMMRPYLDEIMKNSAIENMSLKDKEEAANAGDVDVMEQLAMDYLNGDDVDIDPEKAYYWFVKCAEAGGSGQAMFNAGLLTAKGFGVERDFAKAAEWMQKAADEEDEDAKACVDEYRKLADATEKAIAGDAQAQADLASGLMKLSGSLIQAGEDKDFEESVMWAEKAVAQGCPDGYWILALAYHHGRGVAQDIDKAIEIYQKGADAGNAPCQYNLGCQYMSGENIEKDRHKGFALIKAAAEQGYGLAMKDLGECYQFAIGTPGNMKRAYEWYEKALEVIDDKELEQKVMMLGMISTTDHFDEDYPEDNEDYPGDDEDYPEYDEDYLEDDEDFDEDFPEEDEELDDDEENAGGEEFLINRNVLLRYDGEDENVVIPEGITAIGDGSYMTFLDKKVVSVKIPDTVTSIGAYGFFGCDTLPEIDIPDSVVSIGHHAFRQCTSLKSVTIPDSVSSIERECFWSCTGIEEVKLPKNLKFIEEKAFSGCISLRSVVIPEGTEVIDDCAFWGDESLESITIPASVKRIGEMAFADCNNLTIYTPRGSKAERYAKKHRISYKTMKNSAIESMSLKDKEEAANAGDVDLMEQLAMDYLNGDGVAIDPEKAYYWFVKCAEVGGSGQAMFNVGLLTAKGFGVERDFAKAAEWMQKAADEEDEDAKACVDEYRKLADATEKAIAGDAQAQADLASGLMKLSGSLIQAGEDKDFEESVMWAEKAVAQGCPDGYWILALAYHHGRGVAQDIDKAIEIYQKGADAGNAPCQYNLGCQYMSGENIEKDRHKGFALIKAAAEQGYGLAMKDLGECYQFAIGTPGNMKRAYEWYEKALEVIDDKELEQKVMMLGMISTTDHFDEDYPEDNEDYPGDDEDYPEYDEDYLEDDEDFDEDFPEEDEELDDDEENAGGEEFLINRNVLLRYDGEDENVVIPEGITAIGDGSYMTFLDKKVVSVKIPDTVTSIGAYGFFGCDTLPEIDIPDSVVSIGHHAFRQCTSLKSVTIPDSVSSIERECFWSCTGIEEVKLPKNLKFIEEKAFSGCISLRSVVIPEGTEVIDDCAFWGDESLESITIPASVKRIGEMAFADCNNLTIYAPKGSNAERYAKKHRISYKTK